MSKSPDAFRTIREVADWLGVAAHVLRFWESKFTQIRPVKRAGGRRYYRPADMELVGGIKVLLHDRGMTVRGVQRMLREEGVAAVAALSPPIDAIAIPSELVEGIAEEAAWHDDARAEAATSSAAEVDADAHDDAEAETPVAEAETGIEAETAPEAMPDEAESVQPEPEAPVDEIVDETASPEAPVLPMDMEEQAAEIAPEPEPEPESEAEPEPEAGIAARTFPADGAPAEAASEQPQTAGNGLDRLAAFVAVARTSPEDNRPRLRPAINALRRLKERMEQPVDGTHG
jgi:DNA-binding transcriptional MerR regulator